MKIGLIGAGRIGSAVVKGLLKAGVSPQDIIVKQSKHQTAQKFAEQYNLSLASNNQELSDCEIILLALPGKIIAKQAQELSTIYKGIIVSFGGGDIEMLNKQLHPASFVQATPNTAVEIARGIIPVSFARDESDAVKDKVIALFEQISDVYVVPEDKQGVYGTLAGCTPAYLAVMMDALSDVAAVYGIPRNQATKIIEQMVMGTAQLAHDANLSFGELKDYSATPGGSTIKGVVALEENNFRNAVIKAVQAANGD